jgi:transposase
MVELTIKKRKWIIQQFRTGRSATSIARIQKISRRYVYKLVAKYKDQGVVAYEGKKSGRPRVPI